MKYLAIIGLFITMIGGLLPVEIIVGGPQYVSCWYLPLLGMLLMFFLKKKSLDDVRGISGVIGVLVGAFSAWSIMETLSYPIAAGFSVGKGIPVFLFGSILSCLGGFWKHKITSSLRYHIGLTLVLLSFISFFILGSFASFFYSQFVWWLISMQEIVPKFGTVLLIAVFIGVIIMMSEFIRAILSRTEFPQQT